MPFFIYIHYSSAFDKFYVGHTENPERRLLEHNGGEFHKYTTDYRPWGIAAIFQISGLKGDAMKVESYIKKQKSKSLILKLIDPDFVPTGYLAQLVRVPHVRD